MEKIEEWRQIKGYEGFYEVSSLGRVANLNYKKRGNRRLKVPRQFRNGYLYVDLYKNGKVRRFTIHRLVCETFVPNTNNLPEVDHIDTDRTNNCVSNLRWVTHRENQLNVITRTKNSANWKSLWASGKMNIHKKPVLQLSLDGFPIKEWESATCAAKSIGVSSVGVINTCLGKKHTCGNFKWVYKEDYDNRDRTTAEEEK